MKNLFERFWRKFKYRSVEDRANHFNSLSKTQQSKLLQSFYSDGWFEKFIQDYLDKQLDTIKQEYGIDVIQMRLQAIKNGKIFLIQKPIWDYIIRSLSVFETYDSDVFFGGLVMSEWGRKKQFYKVHAVKLNQWR